MMAGIVRCSHHAAGCRWVDKLHNLQAHLAVCRYDTVACPNLCAATLSRVCLDDHLKFTCLRRTVACESCQQDFSGEAMENHQGNCTREIVWCENKCGARLQRRYLSNHMNNECHKRTVPCHFCHKQFVFETLQDHFYRCPRYPVTCPNRCDPGKIAREDVEQHLQDECPSTTVPCSFRDAGCRATVPRFGLDKHLEEALRAHLSLMCSLTLQQNQQISDLTSRLEDVARVDDGTLIWKISNVKQLMSGDAKSRSEVRSSPFNTSRYGYRLGASVFLSGNGSGAGTHVALYIRVLAGEYDALLAWPFRLPVSFQLLDQCSDPEKRAHIYESFVPNPTWKHFQKPLRDVESMGFGYPKFASHETLKIGTYIKEDTIFIKIKVDMSKFIMP